MGGEGKKRKVGKEKDYSRSQPDCISTQTENEDGGDRRERRQREREIRKYKHVNATAGVLSLG